MLLCCRLRSRRLNQRNPQTLHLLLHMLVILGGVPMVIVMVVSAAHIAVLVVAVLGLPLIGQQWDQGLVVVGLVNMVDTVVEVSLVDAMEIMPVVNLVIEKAHCPIPADLALMVETLVGGMAVGLVPMVVEVVMGVMVELGQVLVMILALVLVMVEQEGECMEVEQVIVAVVDTILMQDRCP